MNARGTLQSHHHFRVLLADAKVEKNNLNNAIKWRIAEALTRADKCVSAAYSISPMNVPISVSSLTNFPLDWERDHQWPNMQIDAQ